MSESTNTRGIFPIQLRRIGIQEISFKSLCFGDYQKLVSEKASIGVNVSDFDDSDNSFIVSVRFSTADNEANRQDDKYKLVVIVVGEFVITDISEPKIPIDKLPDWGRKNGSALLFPFLREIIHNITLKSGFEPLILPMIEVVPYKVSPPPDRMGADIVKL